LKTREIGWKENHEIQNTGSENSKGNITVEKSQVLKIWENYITNLEAVSGDILKVLGEGDLRIMR
jgi:hypothetical protein